MKTINVDLSTGEALNLLIGRQGENNVTQVIFDFSALKTEFGTGTLSLSVKRPKEYVPYAQTMTVSGTNATWLVNETDTGNFGCGEIQLTYTVSGKVAKTVIYKYTVYRSIGIDGEYPIPGQTWQEEIEEDIAEIKEDLAEIEGGGVPTNVRQAVETILKAAVFDNTGLTDEFAIISSWASAVTDITLNQSSISISGATTSQLIATTTPTGGSVAWSSSDTSVATVSSSGLVTGISNGTATITATSGEVSATCSVTVSGISTLSSISAVYTQGGTVYDTDSLDSLKTDLVVTAHYSDATTATISSDDYTLSGTLTVGTSTITVTYGGKTDTFTVTVSSSVNYLYNWDFTQSLFDSVGSKEAILSHSSGSTDPTRTSSGIEFDGANQYCYLGDFGEGYFVGKTIEVDVASFAGAVGTNSQHYRLVMLPSTSNTGSGPLIYKKDTGWAGYIASTWSNVYGEAVSGTSNDVLNYFSGKTVKLEFNSSGYCSLYVNGTLIGTSSIAFTGASSRHLYLGGISSGNTNYCYDMTISGLRIYQTA